MVKTAMNNMKKIYSGFRDALYLMKTYKADYYNFFAHDYSEIKRELRAKGIYKLRISNFSGWKIWYNCCYFKGWYANGNSRKEVFIKVMGPLLDDCFENEELLNRYISQNSEYLAERLPQMLVTTKVGQYSIIATEFVEFNPITQNAGLMEDIAGIIHEYTNVGIIHTDFGFANMGEVSGKNYFFDYGTSLCKESNLIRVRNGKKYNHIQNITNAARCLIPDADFYYDDAAHLSIEITGIDREQMNFIVGKGSIYYARFADETVSYQLKQKWNDDTTFLLEKK